MPYVQKQTETRLNYQHFKKQKIKPFYLKISATYRKWVLNKETVFILLTCYWNDLAK